MLYIGVNGFAVVFIAFLDGNESHLLLKELYVKWSEYSQKRPEKNRGISNYF